MAKNKISEWSATAANNTDIGGIDIAEGCAPSGINNAIRELMAQVKDQQTGTDADNFTVGGNLSVTGTTTATGNLTVANYGTFAAPTIQLAENTYGLFVENGKLAFKGASGGYSWWDNTGSARNMTLNEYGNLALGVTSSAWGSNYKALQINAVGSLASDTGTVFLGNNIYWDGTNNKYLTNSLASSYIQSLGVHKWNTAASGTAGNTASLIEVMTLDANGALILAGSTAQKATGTTWSNPSDIRLKDNVTEYSKGLAELMQVNVKEWTYNGKGGTTEGMKGLGVIADEVMAVLPNTVDTYQSKLNLNDEADTDIKKFDATEITWLMLNSIKEQQAMINELKAKVAALENK
jgi:hypothetical protein